MNMFRPQGMTKAYVFKQRLKFGRSDNYNWQSRVKWYPAGWGFNKRVLGRIHSRLHYLACHAPAPIRVKYRNVYREFCKKHFGDAGRGSVRYLNKYSCHSWL